MPAWSSDASSTHINKHSLFKHVSWYKHQQAYLKCDLDVSASKGEKYIESETKDLNVCKSHISKKRGWQRLKNRECKVSTTDKLKYQYYYKANC